MGDWRRWHDGYEDSASELSRRLLVVQRRVAAWATDAQPGSLRVLSLCAGRGHDVIGALEEHPRRPEVVGLLVELDEENAAIAVQGAKRAGLHRVAVRVADAGACSSFTDGVPADLLVLCGIFGNVPDEDVQRTVQAASSLCAPGATVIWTRHRRSPDLTPSIREWFSEGGFEELDFTSPGPDSFAVGTHRLAGKAAPFDPERRLFTFR